MLSLNINIFLVNDIKVDLINYMYLKSLIYFEDAENEEMPLMFIPVKWKDVKKTISKALSNYLSTL